MSLALNNNLTAYLPFKSVRWSATGTKRTCQSILAMSVVG